MESLFQHAMDLQRQGRLDEAEAAYLRLGDHRAKDVRTNLGILYRMSGRLEDAEAAFRAALALAPDDPHIRHSLGMTLLQAGRYAEGWRQYAARIEVRRMAPPPPGMPEWRGESLAGKRLMVVAEQGLGDQILLARFVKATDADEAVYACARPLARLLSPLAAEITHPADWGGVRADCWTYAGLIPMWLDLGPADAPAPYLPCPDRPGAAGFGLMLQGAADNANNANRLPPPEVAEALRGLADFIDLAPETSGARDLAETAEILTSLSGVVTVDTSVAHLAGAMGKACHVLMAAHTIDWWTSRSGDSSPWYPSVRLIRQAGPGDWSSVIEQVRGVVGAA
jgi:tetratricopeptide (TPR) repeat protein